MTKYEEFLKFHSANYSKEYQEWLKIRLDEVIEEKLHEFIDWHNDHPDTKPSKYISNSEIGKFLQNKEELNVRANTENPYDLNKFGGLIKNKEE